MAIMYDEQIYPLRQSDFDYNDNIRISAILDYFQELAGIHANKIGVGFNAMVENKIFWVLIRSRFEIYKQPLPNQQIKVTTWPKQKGKIDFDRDYEILSLDGELMVKASSKWVTIDMDTRRIVRSDKINYIGDHLEKSNFDSLDKLHIEYANKETKEMTYIVSNSDIDHNRHMNNAKYGDLILNMVTYPANFVIKSFQMEHIKEAKLNDIITVHYFIENNEHNFVGLVSENRCFNAKIILEE